MRVVVVVVAVAAVVVAAFVAAAVVAVAVAVAEAFFGYHLIEYHFACLSNHLELF